MARQVYRRAFALTMAAIGMTPATAVILENNILIGAEVNSHDYFGAAVSIDGNTLVVGAERTDTRGAAYLFDTSTGAQTHRLLASDRGYADSFGHSVAISGNVVAIGAHGDDDVASGSGAVYLYDASTGAETHKLKANDAEDGDYFGYSVAMSGNTLVIGARDDEPKGYGSGSAYLFDASTGSQTHKLVAADGHVHQNFGDQVAVSGDIVAISAAGDTDNGHASGAVYLFDAQTGAQTHKLTALDAESNTSFGSAIAIDGNYVVAGAPGDDENGSAGGAVYVFDATTGNQLHKLLAPESSYLLPSSLAVVGNTIFVGVDNRAENGVSSAGAVYVYAADTGDYIDTLLPSSPQSFMIMGNAITADENNVYAGTPWDGTNGSRSGSVYVFDNPSAADSVSAPGMFWSTLALLALSRRFGRRHHKVS